ncbi:MAG TPA: DNA primase, partial [Stackebrandtia sp.]|nr:DNA primase [Stackebrandtia sp.]
PYFDAVDDSFYRDELYRAVRVAITAAGGAGAAGSGPNWLAAVTDACGDMAAAAMISELAVEPLRVTADPDASYVNTTLAGVQVPVVDGQVRELKSRLQRVNPASANEEYMTLFGELITLEQRLRGLKEKAVGGL